MAKAKTSKAKKAAAKKASKTKKPAKRAAAKSRRTPAKKSKVKKSKVKKAKAKKARKAAGRKAAPRKAAAPKKKQKLVGEGDYDASRSFLKDQSDFVKKNKAKIPEMGREAERALDGPEGESLRAAEQEAMTRSTIE